MTDDTVLRGRAARRRTTSWSATACWPSCATMLGAGRRARWRVIHPERLASRSSSRRCSRTLGASRCRARASPTARRPRPAEVAATCWDALGDAGFTRSDAVVTRRRRRDHRPGRLRRRDLAARRPGRARADDAARHGRRRGRRQDRHQHRRRQEPRRRVPRARRRALRPRAAGRPCRAPSSSPAWPRSSSAASSPTRRSCGSSRSDPARSTPALARAARAGRARDPGQGRRRRRRPQGDRRRATGTLAARSSTTATRWRTRSSASRTTASGTARRSRSAWSSSPSWPGWPGGSTTTLVDAAPRRRSAWSGCRDATRARPSTSCTPRCRWTRSRAGPAAVRGARRPRRAGGPDRAVRGRPAGGVRGDRLEALREGPGAQRPQPRSPRPAAARDLRHHHLRRAGAAVRRVGRDLGLDVEVRQTNHEGELLDWLNEAADDDTPGRAQRRGVDATTPTRSSTPAPS